jgi:hypothetical protein
MLLTTDKPLSWQKSSGQRKLHSTVRSMHLPHELFHIETKTYITALISHLQKVSEAGSAPSV